MITDKTDFILAVNRIIKALHWVDTETKMMAINGIMAGHGITWKQVNLVLVESVKDTEYPALKAELGPFVSMQDYFIYQINSGAFGKYSHFSDSEPVYSRCMDFTLLEAGNRVNMAENNGPY